MDIAAKRSSEIDGRRGFSRPLVVVGLAAAAIGSGAILLLIAGTFTGLDNPPGWAWLKTALGLSDNTLAAIVVGAPLAACLVGLILGVSGCAIARSRGTDARASKRTVFLSLIGPVAIPVLLLIGYVYLIYFSSWQVPN